MDHLVVQGSSLQGAAGAAYEAAPCATLLVYLWFLLTPDVLPVYSKETDSCASESGPAILRQGRLLWLKYHWHSCCIRTSLSATSIM